MQLLMENWKQFLDEKADPSKVDPAMFPTKLSAVDPARAKALSNSGAQDGVEDDDQISVTPQPAGVAGVADLKPSQSSMNIQKALTFALHMIDHPSGKMEPGGDLGAFISSDGFIMDGHHRWISTAMVDPSKQVGGYLVDFPGEQLVSILNAMTKGMFGVMKGKAASGGFEQFQAGPIEQQLKKFVQGGISSATAPDTFKGWQAMTPEGVLEGLEAFTQQEGEAAIKTAVHKMVQNLSGLTMSTPGWAPARPDMPVIDEPDVPTAVKALDTGLVNVNAPYKKGERQVAAEGRKKVRIKINK